MSREIEHSQFEDETNYDKLKGAISNLYPDGLSAREAEEATQNLIGFTQLLLEIKCRQAQTPEHE